MGWTGVHLLPVLGLNTSMTNNVRKKVYVGDDPSGHPCQVPDWCGNWNAAGPLIREYKVDIMHSWDHVYFRDSKDSHTRKNVSTIESEDRIDKSKLDEQMRIGIVEAVIHSIETDSEIMKETANATDPV